MVNWYKSVSNGVTMSLDGVKLDQAVLRSLHIDCEFMLAADILLNAGLRVCEF